MLAAAGLLANAAPSAARINVDPAASQAAKDAVAACLAQIKTVPRGAEIINALERHGRTVRINFTNVPMSESSTPSNSLRAQRAADGTSGGGSDSTLDWHPTDREPFPSDSTLRADPCATLLHELKHSLDSADGIGDFRETEKPGLPNTEVGATRVENIYRTAKGLGVRTKYGGDSLPNDAVVTSTGPPRPATPPRRTGPSELTPGGSRGGTPDDGTTGSDTTGGGTTGGGTTGTDTTDGGTGGGGTTGGGTTGGGTTGGGTTGGGGP